MDGRSYRNVIGLAANIDLGMIAVSIDGNWGDDDKDDEDKKKKNSAYGVVFQSDDIKQGVYPCITCDSHTVQYNFGSSSTTTTNSPPFKYGPPPETVWKTNEN